MRYSLVALFILLSAVMTQAQTGPCTESVIQQGHLSVADDAFSYMPPYGKPVVGKPAMEDANKKSFSARTKVKSSWVGDHRIVSAPSGDVAYEYGTRHVSYDCKDGHHEFEAVMLHVYKAKDGACQMVAMTMHPLGEQSKQRRHHLGPVMPAKPIRSHRQRCTRRSPKGLRRFGATNGRRESLKDSTSSRCRSRTFESSTRSS